MTNKADSALLIEAWPIDQLVPYIANARRLTDRAVATVAASLREFGWRQPIVVDKKGVVIVGHTRLLAAQSLGLETVPVHVATNLTAKQVASYRLMDNRSAEESSWNMELLVPELKQLQKTSDLALTGFSEKELNEFLRIAGTNPPLEESTVARWPNGRYRSGGPVWLLGKHCLVCGDNPGEDIDAVVDLWQKFTGSEVTLDGDGRTFAEIKAASKSGSKK
jgi:ParB-like nuclease domain